mgnify:FL=1|jgi:hypothetical protein
MFKGFRSKLPLLVGFCLLNSLSFLPASAVDVCAENTGKGDLKIAEHYDRDRDGRYDNQYGERGSDGRAGKDGRSGQNQTLSAEGSPLSLDLSGRNGEDGEAGENASSSRYGKDYSENVNRDINPPDGGNAGVGGKGRDVGKADSLSVYYTNFADLRKIFICATGGEGGCGGRGGQGTKGYL